MFCIAWYEEELCINLVVLKYIKEKVIASKKNNALYSSYLYKLESNNQI